MNPVYQKNKPSGVEWLGDVGCATKFFCKGFCRKVSALIYKWQKQPREGFELIGSNWNGGSLPVQPKSGSNAKARGRRDAKKKALSFLLCAFPSLRLCVNPPEGFLQRQPKFTKSRRILSYARRRAAAKSQLDGTSTVPILLSTIPPTPLIRTAHQGGYSFLDFVAPHDLLGGHP